MPQKGPQSWDREGRCGKQWQEAKKKAVKIKSKTFDRNSSNIIFLKDQNLPTLKTFYTEKIFNTFFFKRKTTHFGKQFSFA